MENTPLTVDGESLSCETVAAVACEGLPVRLGTEAKERIQRARTIVEQKASAGEVVYGVTTGFGKFADVVISPEQTRTLQQNLIASHAVGVGEGFSKEVVRAMLLLRANALAKGHSGLRLCVVQRLVDFLNLHLHPVVPQQGSLGASGDLAPLAHVALALVGEGQIMGPNGPRPARELLEEHDLPPLVLEAKEGLALINGTQAMTAQGALTLAAAARLTRAAEAAAALSFQALRGIPQAFDERIQAVRPHQGQRRTAQRLRALLEDSRMTTRPGELRVQDAYSLRCLPQVIGAVRQALDHTRQVLEIELNSATDNPLIFEADGAVISAGNFHGQPVAMVLDYLALALAELASIAERRIERLVNPQLSEGLPPFLTRQGGLNSGMMLLQYTAAALVSENKSLAHPASVDSIPSSANQEDHVSMGTISARKTQRIYENTARVIAIELLCAAQAVEFRTSDPGRDLSRPTQGVFEAVRELSPRLERDRPLSEDIERVAGWLQTDEIDKLVGHE